MEVDLGGLGVHKVEKANQCINVKDADILRRVPLQCQQSQRQLLKDGSRRVSLWAGMLHFHTCFLLDTLKSTNEIQYSNEHQYAMLRILDKFSQQKKKKECRLKYWQRLAYRYSIYIGELCLVI